MVKENELIYLSDSPNIDNDSFKIHTNIADTLFDVINYYKIKDNAFTIGLFGEWGSGKTFIINKLQNKIEEETDKITFINIDVWKYSGRPLLRSILFELDKHFKRLYKKEKKNIEEKNIDSDNKYEDFKDGYKNSNGKSLKDILYYDEVFESVSKLTSKDFKGKLKKIWERYRPYYIFLLFIFIIFLLFQFVPQDWLEIVLVQRINDFLSILAPISSFVGISGFLIYLFKKPVEEIIDLVFFRNTVKNFTEKANFSPEQFEGIFKDMILKIPDNKFVIVFDNIDRCEPHVAYETLSTIKTFMDIENCFYIIPADDDAIQRYLSETNRNYDNSEIIEDNCKDNFEREFAKEFIDKIFQTYIRIPILKEVERDQYIKEQLKKLDLSKELQSDDIDTITQILYFAYKGESPRNIIRFINDYSSYYKLASRSLPDLLNNKTLFTIMVAIKQKWHKFEKYLISHPTFFSDYLINKEDTIKQVKKEADIENMSGLDNFLEKISVAYIPKIQNKSLNSYIHFKESEKSYEISDMLKSNNPGAFEFNEESFKILLREFEGNIKRSSGGFLINSFLMVSSLIINTDGETNNYYSKLIKKYWCGFDTLDSNQIESVLTNLYKNKKLQAMINTLNKLDSPYYLDRIDKKIVSYFDKYSDKDKAHSEQEKIFKIILESDFKLKSENVNKLFKNWEINNEYLNSLINIIAETGNNKYLPENVIETLIQNINNKKSIEIIKNWNSKDMPKYHGIELCKAINQRLKNRKFNNLDKLNNQRADLLDDHSLMNIIDDSFVTKSIRDEFFNNLKSIINRIFTNSNNRSDMIELGIKFWLITVSFTKVDEKMIDNILHPIFNKRISNNKKRLDIFEKNIKYPKKLLFLNSVKKSIYDTSEELQKTIYKKLDNDSFSNYQLVLTSPVNIDHVKVFLNYVEKNNIHIDNTSLSKYLLENIIKEIVNEKEVSNKLEFLINNFELKKHKNILIDHRNGIIDYYKDKPSNAIDSLIKIKSILNYDEFYSNILEPILKHINDELYKSEQIMDYINLAPLIENPVSKENNDLLYSIARKCLEKNQEIKENNFGIMLLEKVYNKISDSDKNKIIELVKSNDNYQDWTDEMLNNLKKLGIVKGTDGNKTN